ncbi:MAG: helix-turn-helix transcriptional regulator [Flavobacteriales bacterium]|nr:helix-turn-helix transcriptional regulator [Flavobacteriales bacterium]
MKGQLKLHGHVFAEMMVTDQEMRRPNIMDNDACLYYILNGTGEIYSPTEKVVIHKHDSVLMKCGNYIGCFVDAYPGNEHKSVGFHFNPELVRQLVKDGKLTFAVPIRREEVSAVRFAENEQLNNYVDGLMYYLEHPDSASEPFIELKMQELLMILLQSGKAEPLLAEVLGRMYEPQQIEFDRVIEANLYHNLSIPELALLTNRSESTFKRDFKRFYSTSPAKFFREKRLTKASELLLQSALQINEIAWDCGFESAAHFSKAFFQVFGKWPREYRLTQIDKS